MRIAALGRVHHSPTALGSLSASQVEVGNERIAALSSHLARYAVQMRQYERLGYASVPKARQVLNQLQVRLQSLTDELHTVSSAGWADWLERADGLAEDVMHAEVTAARQFRQEAPQRNLQVGAKVAGMIALGVAIFGVAWYAGESKKRGRR